MEAYLSPILATAYLFGHVASFVDSHPRRPNPATNVEHRCIRHENQMFEHLTRPLRSKLGQIVFTNPDTIRRSRHKVEFFVSFLDVYDHSDGDAPSTEGLVCC
jgi:hypothetical protein